MDEKYIQELYGQLGGKDKFGEYNDFKDLISSNDEYQKAFHAEYGEKQLGAFNDFQSLVKKKDSTPFALPGQVDISEPLSNGANQLSTAPPSPAPEQQILTGQIPEPPSSGITIEPTIAQDKTFKEAMAENRKPLTFEEVGLNYEKKRKAEEKAKASMGDTYYEMYHKPEPQGAWEDFTTDIEQIPPAFNKGVIQAFTSIPKAVGILAQGIEKLTGWRDKPIEEYPTYQLGKAIEDKATELGLTVTDPRHSNFFNADLSNAFGSMLGMMATGGASVEGAAAKGIEAAPSAINALKGAAPLMTTGAAQNAVPEFEAAKAAGMNDDEAFKVFLKNVPGGLTEAAPIIDAFGRLNKLTKNSIVNVFKVGTANGLEEAAQEGVQQWATNLVAQGTYDPKRVQWEGMVQSLGAAFVVGFVLPAVITAMQHQPKALAEQMLEDIHRALKENEGKGKGVVGQTIQSGVEKNIKTPEGDLGNEKPIEQSTKVAGQNIPEIKKEENVPVQTTQEKYKEEVPISPEGKQKVFVYGTLKDPSIRKEAIGEHVDTEMAVAPNTEKFDIKSFPDIKHEEGNNLRGEVLELTPEQIKKLDKWEEKYERSTIILENGEKAFVYKLKSKENAIQEPSTSSILQHPQEGVGKQRSERQRMELGKQGDEPTQENRTEKEKQQAPLGNNQPETINENTQTPIEGSEILHNEPETKTKEETFGKGFKVLGTNLEGLKVGEDKNGVRAVLNEKGIIHSQPVSIVPGKGYFARSPEGEFLTTEESKGQADKIAKEYGFDSPSHLLNSIKKRTGEEYENVQDVPKDVLNRTHNERELEKLPPKQPIEKTGNNEDDFVKEVSSSIGSENLGKKALEKIGQENGITDKNIVKELTEYAIVEKAKELSKKDDFEGLVKLYDDQPSLTHRTNESIEKQQYSTPAPISYMIGKFVRLDKAKFAIEPSAGNGMLTIAGDPNIFTVNEIDETRLSNLKKQGFGEVLSQDGSMPFEIGQIYDAVITNPPFGGTEAVDFDGYKINELAQIMAIRALNVMKDNGKAAIIIGGNNKFDESGRLTGRDRIFLNYLYNHYNVKDVIDVNGDLYRKQGASFPIRIILIDGRKVTPSGAAPLITSFGERENTFEGIKNRIEKYISNENIQPTELVGEPTNTVRSGGTEPNTEVKPEPTTLVPKGEVSKSGKGRNRGQGTVEQSGTIPSGNVGGVGTKSRPAVDSGINIGEQPIIEPVNGQGQAVEQQSIESGGIEAVPEPRTRYDRKIAEGVQSGESTVVYQPVSKGKAFDLMSPAGMKQEILDAQTDLLNDVGDVDTFVQDKLGYKTKAEMYDALGAEQIDGVALAIRNIERGTGIIIGDQTGVGKGRQAAAIIRYANQQGLSPIFLTEKPNLFSDLYRDLLGIKYGDINPFIVNTRGEKFNGIADEKGTIVFKAPSTTDKVQKDFIKRGSVPKEANLILATYSQFSSPAYKNKIDFLKNVAYNNIIILDEAHNASGDGNTSHLFQEILPNTKGVVYLSGTFAKRANNMPIYALKTSMREANVSTEQLIQTIEHGGVALQEIISSQLAESGEMIRRERTFKGIEVNNLVIGANDEPTKAKQLKQANQVTDVMNDIIKFQLEHVAPVVNMMDDSAKREGEKIVGREGTSMAGVDNTPYFSKVFNVVNQLLYSIKAKETALFAIQELKAGRKPFIAIRSTMEAMLKDIVERGDVKIGDAIDADFRFVLQKGLEGVMRISRKDAQGNSIKEDIPVSNLFSGGQDEYRRIRSKIANLESGLTISPIDELVQTLSDAGYKVGEVTGRQMKLKLKDSKAILEHNKKEPVNELYRKYNNGDIDVLIVNSSGSTGASAHSDSKFKDQRQRSMLILEPELNISTLVQILGRINRTGQINKPKYTFISSNIPAELRLMMMTMRKLKSLDANTTSNQKQSNNLIEVPEIFNKYGDEVVIEYLTENPEIIAALGDPLKMLEGSEVKEPQMKEGASNKVTGRVAILPTDKQAAFYSDITDRYNKYINFLNDAGLNDLQVEYLPLKSKQLTKKPVILGKGGRSKFGEDTYLEEVEADNLKKPMTKSEIDETMKDIGGFSPEFLLRQINDYAETLYKEIGSAEDEKLNTKIEKVNNSKETNEDKQKFIQGAKELYDLTKDYKINKEKETIKYLESLFKFFQPGLAVKTPKDFNETVGSEMNLSDAIFLGFDVNLKKPKPFVRSNVTLKLAVNDSRRLINLPATKSTIINNIRANSYDLSESHKKHVVNDWDKLDKPKARSKRHIVTGNILQGLASYKGQIVKYSTDKGFINTGILMPEHFDPKESELNKMVSVPASKAAPIIINSAPSDSFTGGGVTITKKSENKFSIRVPKPKQTGGKFYLSTEVNDLVDNGRWDSVGGEMETFTDSSRMEELLEVLTNKFGVSFAIDAKKASEIIKNEPPPDDNNPSPNKPLSEILSKGTQENVSENYEDFSGAMSTGIPIKPIGKVKKSPSDNALLALIAQSGKTKEELEKELKEQVKIGDSEVDERIDNAAAPAPPNMTNSWGEAITGIKNWATQHFRHLNSNVWPREANILREFETLYPWAKGNATQYVKTLVDGMTPNQYKVFSMKVILSDMLESIEKGLKMTGVDGKLPFGFKDELQVRKALKKYDSFAAADVRIQRALEMRDEFMKEFKEQLISSGLLDNNDIENYYHRRVLEYHAENENRSILFGKDIADKKKDFQKRRKGTRGLDYSTNFLETEFKVVSEGLYEMEKQRILKDLVGPFEVKLKAIESDFEKEYNTRLTDVEDQFGITSEEYKRFNEGKRALKRNYMFENLPEGYTLYRVSDENRLFWGKTVSQNNLDRAIEQAEDNDNSGMSEALTIVDELISSLKSGLMVGPKRKQYMLPTQLAEQLDEMAKSETISAPSNLATKFTSAWKQLMILSPTRLLRYNLNNFGSDIDRLIQVEPKIAKCGKEATSELWRYLKYGETTPQLLEAMRGDVINSGFQISELADISKEKWAESLTNTESSIESILGKEGMKKLAIKIKDSPGNLWTKYMDAVLPYVQFRENILRYAAYKLASEKTDKGEAFYWASDPNAIRQIKDVRQKNAKLARDVFGDYMNLSQAGHQLRRVLLPFYSWFEVNMKTHYNLIKNAGDPKAQKEMVKSAVLRGIPSIGFRMAKSYVMLGLFTAAIQAWNKYAFCLYGGDDDTERKLRATKIKGLQLIIGVSKDGHIRTIPIQGALYDFIDFFGLWNIGDDIEKIFSGEDAVKATTHTLKSVGENMANKGAQLMTPLVKSPLELASGQSYYPDIFNPTPINDKWEYLFKSMTLGDEYNYGLSNKPKRESYLSRKFHNSLLREFDTEQLSYYAAKKIINEYEGGDVGGSKGEAQNPTRNDQKDAEYKFMLALRFGKYEDADKWLGEYLLKGGNPASIKQKLKSSNPFAAVKKVPIKGESTSEWIDLYHILNDKNYKPQTHFGRQITSEDKFTLKEAMNYYERIIKNAKEYKAHPVLTPVE